jgi:hypothetical protein
MRLPWVLLRFIKALAKLWAALGLITITSTHI